MHPEINHVQENQPYEGITDIKLSNGAADPVFGREVLNYWIHVWATTARSQFRAFC